MSAVVMVFDLDLGITSYADLNVTLEETFVDHQPHEYDVLVDEVLIDHDEAVEVLIEGDDEIRVGDS